MEAIPLVRLPVSELIPRHDDSYIDTGIVPRLDQLAWSDPLILMGPKGSGKTLAIEEFCSMVGAPRVRQNCNSETSSRDLIGTYGMQGDSVFFSLGTLTTAIEVANEYGACVLILEEINTLRPELHSALFSVADFRRAVEVPSLGKIFTVNPGCQFWIVGTMNPGYGGTYHLNEALKSRFIFAPVPYMDSKKEKMLLEQSFSSPPGPTERKIVNRLLNLAEESRSGKWDYALGTRDLVQMIRVIERIGLKPALRILEGKFDPEHYQAIRGRIQSVFDIDPANVELWCSNPMVTSKSG